jgi:hypothetical protein
MRSKKQPQILRLTTPKLHPKEQKSLFGDPGKRLGPRLLRMTDSLFINGLHHNLYVDYDLGI